MPDLEERFRSLARTTAPDLWDAIRDRRPERLPRPPIVPRLVASLVALAVASAGVGLAVVGFRPDGRDRSGAAADGRIVFSGFDGTTWQIYSVAPDGTGLSRLTHLSDVEVAVEPAWSPDGRQIAFVIQGVREDGGTGRSDIWVMGADGSSPHPITNGPGSSWAPSWSPDGTRIVYVRDAAGERSQIWIVGADGSNPVAFTHCGGECLEDSSPAWSPDGGRIAFVRSSGAGAIVPVSLMVWPIEGSEDVQVIEIEDATWASEVDWSPDGTELAFTRSFEDGSRFGIAVVGVDGSGLRSFADLPSAQSPSWSPDGSRIVVQRTDTETGRIGLLVMNEDGTGVRAIPGLPIDATSPAWQPVASEEPTPPFVPTTAEVVGTIDVGQDVRSVVYGEGSAWVAVSNDDGTFAGRILRIDPATHDVQAEITVEAIPTWEVGGGAMVVHEGSLWLTSGVEAPGDFDDPGGGADAVVIRIDASTNEVVETFELGGQVGADLTFLDGELWVLLFGDETADNRMEVVRVDPETGDVRARIPLSSGWAHTIAGTEGHLVTVVGGSGAVNVDGRVVDVDASSGTASEAEVPSRYVTPMPVVWRGQIWISLDRGFVRYDPSRGVFAQPSLSLPARYADCCGFLEADDRGVWFLSLDPQTGTDRRLNLFDPSTGAVHELVDLVEGTPVAMAVAPDSVWILNYEGTLTHVALN